jgi:purine-nucleoside phosphorylase
MFDADAYERRLDAAASFLERHFGTCPPVAVIAGTGLGRLGRETTVAAGCPYADIPGFPGATAPGHRGELLATNLGGLPTLVFQGRFHLYEGHAPQDAVFPFRAVFRWGVRGLVVTNAAGGLDLSFRPGDSMLIVDHINAMGDSALAGPHRDAWGARFPDMSSAYDPALRSLALRQAAELGLALHQGVYVAVRGPCLETPAETRLYRRLGADAIGMSTVQEVMAARQAGVRVLGFSAISNVNDPERMAVATIEDILAAADRAAVGLSRLIAEVRRCWPGETCG